MYPGLIYLAVVLLLFHLISLEDYMNTHACEVNQVYNLVRGGYYLHKVLQSHGQGAWRATARGSQESDVTE